MTDQPNRLHRAAELFEQALAPDPPLVRESLLSPPVQESLLSPLVRESLLARTSSGILSREDHA